MDGSIPPILWYLLLLAFFVWMAVGLSTQSVRDHRARMRELDILKIYAEKGMDPPDAVAERLIRPGPKPSAPPHHTQWAGPTAGAVADPFAKFGWELFMAGIFGGLAWWRIDAGGPQWAIYVLVIAAIIFAAGAVGALLAGLVKLGAAAANPPRDE
jgi:hypothetical protein